MRYVTGKKLRPLLINFDIYQDSDDLEFRLELVSLMAGSLKELLASASEALEHGKVDLFKKAVHKSKSTLVLLKDNDLDVAVERFTSRLENQEFNRLREICLAVVDSLGEEAIRIKQKL